MIKAHQIRLNPTPEQATYFMKAAGTARFAYNWAVAVWQQAQGKKPTALDLKKRFNAEKPAWVYAVTKCAAEGAFTDFGKALSNFYAGRAQTPSFKKRSRGDFSFKLNNDKFDVRGHWIKIPKLGLVNMAEQLRFSGKILGATVSKQADWWYVSITLDLPDVKTLPKPGACGVDVGLLRLATLSDGTLFENVRSLRRNLDKLAALQRILARKQPGSKNRAKIKAKLARLHKRIGDVRQDVLHKITTWIAQRYGLVAIEDLNVKGMTQNHCLALSLSDAALGRLLDLLETKVICANGLVVKVDRFYPSSKTCAHCDCKVQDMPLGQRIFACPACGFVADRDHNAAMNILKEGLRLASEQASSVVATAGCKTPPQTGYNLDTCSDSLSTSDHVCVSER
jgi:putative transposase